MYATSERYRRRPFVGLCDKYRSSFKPHVSTGTVVPPTHFPKRIKTTAPNPLEVPSKTALTTPPHNRELFSHSATFTAFKQVISNLT
ncbi:hypothetical protein H2248_012017 [Termitomyces sp. 'cryptogamus']|nr:hypothetical protein H2248_012017 [Termitomyces sp. 'cryptogamus']